MQINNFSTAGEEKEREASSAANNEKENHSDNPFIYFLTVITNTYSQQPINRTGLRHLHLHRPQQRKSTRYCKMFNKKGNGIAEEKAAQEQQQQGEEEESSMDCTADMGNNTGNACFLQDPPAVVPTCVDPAAEIAAASAALAEDYENRLTKSMGATAISVTLAFLVLVYHFFGRRQQRRQQSAWNQTHSVLASQVDDLVETLATRDQEVQALESKLVTLKESTGVAQEQAEQDLHRLLQSKQEHCDKLQAKLEDLRKSQKETEARLAQVMTEVNQYAEQQQDHDCQLLEQKLQASQLEQTLSERDAKIEQMQHTLTAQANRIEELLHKAKADAHKAETFIQTVSSERDDRFSVLQQENDAIKTTVMGLLRSTQESYDADKFLLKREMRKRDDRIRSLQDDLWKSQGLLKRLVQAQGMPSGADAKLNASVSQLMTKMEEQDDAKETKEDDHAYHPNQKKNKRGSTYEAAENILEGKKKECAELKQLQNLLGAK